MKLKRILAIPLVVSMISTSVVPVYAQEQLASASIKRFVEKGILLGDGEGIRQSDSITRAEFAMLIERIMKYEKQANNSFDDVPQAWYTSTVLKAVEANILSGYNNQIRPLDTMTREEVAVIICRAFYLESEAAATAFSDEENISEWARESVNTLKAKGIVNGKAGNNYQPKSAITRQEAIDMLDRVAKKIISSSEASGITIDGTTVVNSEEIVLKDLQIQGDLILTQGVKKATIDNVVVSGHVIVSGGNIEINGDVASVLVKDNASIVLQSGTIGCLEVDDKALNTQVVIHKDGTILKLVMPEGMANITGTGNIVSAQLRAVDGKLSNVEISLGANTSTASTSSGSSGAGGTDNSGGTGNQEDTGAADDQEDQEDTDNKEEDNQSDNKDEPEIVTTLEQSHIHINPGAFVESTVNPGAFNTEVLVTISDETTTKFNAFDTQDVDSISGASTVGTLPRGVSMSMQKVDDKNVKLTLQGLAREHGSIINTTNAGNDYNANGIYGDIKLLLLPSIFTDVTGVENDGVYAICDVIYTDEIEESETILSHYSSKIMNVEQVHYGVLEMMKGNSDDYHFELNGEEILPTPVNDQKTIVKFEVNPNQVAQVKVVAKHNDNLTDTLNMDIGNEPFTGVIKDEAPIKILTSGPISVFDYYLSNYDKDGNIRILPQKTTFDTVSEGVEVPDETIPTLWVEKTNLGDDIEITFDPSTSEAQHWQQNIYAVLKDYGTGQGSRQPLQFRVEDGKVIVDANSTAIADRNGKHTIIISSKGYNNAAIQAEIVKPAGDILLSGNYGWWAYQDLLFELTGFNYAIINPIYEVLLDGEVLDGDCEEYHIISNLIRLENNCLQKLTPGEHTITVKAEGYRDFTKTFYLEIAPDGVYNPTFEGSSETLVNTTPEIQVYDGVSAASSGGSSGGSSSGSVVVRANIIFDFDLIANAFILAGMNNTTNYSNNVMDWWYALTKDAIITTDGQDKLVDYTYFKNNGGMVQDGEYQTFKKIYDELPKQDDDMFTPEHPGIYLNRPYNVKNMLEDGLLGEIYAYAEITAKTSPNLFADAVNVGEDIVIGYNYIADIEEWLENIQCIKLGYTYLQYSYDKENDRIIVPAEGNAIATGDNHLIVYADGYNPAKITVNVSKKNESDLQVSKDTEGNIYISGLSDDFAKSIKGMSINGKYLFNDSQMGQTNGDYELNSNVIKLKSKLFEDSDGTQQTLIIEAEGYHNVYVQFTPNKAEDGEPVLGEVPSFVELSSMNTYLQGEDVILIVESMFDTSSYRLKEVYVNEQIVSNKGGAWNAFVIAGEVFAQPGVYSIVLTADGYKDKVFDILIEEKSNLAVPDYVKADNTSVEVGRDIRITIGTWSDTKYVKVFEGIIVDQGTEVEKELSRSELNINDYSTSFTLSNLSIGKHTVTLKAEGYREHIIDIEVTPKSVPSMVKLIVDGEVISSASVSIDQQDLKVIIGDAWSTTYREALEGIMINNTWIPIEACIIQQEQVGYFSTYDVIVISADQLVESDYTIVLKAANYMDKVFTISVRLEDRVDDQPSQEIEDILEEDILEEELPEEVIAENVVEDAVEDMLEEIIPEDNQDQIEV